VRPAAPGQRPHGRRAALFRLPDLAALGLLHMRREGALWAVAPDWASLVRRLPAALGALCQLERGGADLLGHCPGAALRLPAVWYAVL